MSLNSKIGIVVLLLTLFSQTTKAVELEHNAGFGVQYGGLIGYQLSTQQEQHQFRAAVGVIGLSGGYDYFVSPNVSIGASYTRTIRDLTSINLNYYPNGSKKGFIIGLDLIYAPPESGGFYKSPKESLNKVLFSIGYRF